MRATSSSTWPSSFTTKPIAARRRDLSARTSASVWTISPTTPTSSNSPADEFTGPTHFTQFWLDTIAEWEHETGKQADDRPGSAEGCAGCDSRVTQRGRRCRQRDRHSILVVPTQRRSLRPARRKESHAAAMVVAGRNSPASNRPIAQCANIEPSSPTKSSSSRHEYGPTPPGWGVLMGGGSLPAISNLDPQLLAAIPTMRPIDVAKSPSDQYVLGKEGGDYLVYRGSDGAAQLDLPAGSNSYAIRSIDPRSGRMSEPSDYSGSGHVELKAPGFAPVRSMVETSMNETSLILSPTIREASHHRSARRSLDERLLGRSIRALPRCDGSDDGPADDRNRSVAIHRQFRSRQRRSRRKASRAEVERRRFLQMARKRRGDSWHARAIETLDAKLDSLIDLIAKTQEADGYIHTDVQIAQRAGKDDAALRQSHGF